MTFVELAPLKVLSMTDSPYRRRTESTFSEDPYWLLKHPRRRDGVNMRFYNASMIKWAAKTDDEWAERVRAFTSSKHDLNVLLDHGGNFFHGEVFYSVANLVTKLLPLHNITFFICQHFAEAAGLAPFWGKYAAAGPIPNLQYHIRRTASHWAMDRACNRSSIDFPAMRALDPVNGDTHFDMHVQVTVGNVNTFGCMPLYVDDPRYLVVMHHAEHGNPHTLMSNWRNSFIASSSEGVRKLTPRFFTPSLMPLHPRPPDCNAPPVFMVQGSTARRNLTELRVLLDMVRR